MNFTVEELSIIRSALFLVAHVYEADAEECDKHENCERVAAQFRKQMKEARAIAEKIEEEHGL